MTQFLNMTPHTITIHTEDREHVLLPSGQVPRLAVTREALGTLPIPYMGSFDDCDKEVDDDIPVVRTKMGSPEGLPDEKDGVILIVSALIAEHPHLQDRGDLAYPGEAVRDDSGRIVGCQGLCAGQGLACRLRMVSFGQIAVGERFRHNGYVWVKHTYDKAIDHLCGVVEMSPATLVSRS